ncbi:MAG: hypothetical protein FWG90_05730 [Oscillospiraceae bacterium]|nr:hypothetical protein [Oscillospiraceae bacterium]
MKKALLIMVSLLLIFLFASCDKKGKGENDNGALVPLTEEKIDLTKSGIKYILDFSVVGERIFLIGKESNYFDPGMGGKEITKLFIFDFEGNIVSETEINHWMYNVAIDSEGLIWSLEHEWDYAGAGNGLVLNCFDTSGEHLKTLTLSEIDYTGVELLYNNAFLIDDRGQFYIKHFDTEFNGRFYQPIGGGKTVVLGKNGEFICDIESTLGYENYGIFKLFDGRIVTYQRSNTNPWEYNFKEIDLNSKSLINSVNFNYENTAGSIFVFSGNEAYDLLYYDLNDLYGYDIKTSSNSHLMNWNEREINIGSNLEAQINPSRVLALGSEKIYMLLIEGGEMATQLLQLTVADSSNLEKSSKKEVRLSALYLENDMLDAIADFNQKSDEYYITTQIYTNQISPTFENELTQFNIDLLSGNIPDFIFLNDNMPFESLIAKGLFADLYDFIDNDESIKRSDYLPNILSALESNGKLYTAVTSFGVRTLAGKTSDVGEHLGWTWEGYNALVSGKPPGIIPIGYEFSYFTKADFLEAVLYSNMNAFVNFNELTSNFNSDNFINFLKIANEYPNELNAPPALSFKDGNPLLMKVDLTLFDNFRVYEDIHFGEEITFIGYPSTGENHSSFMAFNRFAITEKAKEKDGAHSFAKYLLTDYQENTGNLLKGNGLPIKKSSLEALSLAAKSNPADGNSRKTMIYDGQGWIAIEIGNNTEEDNQKIFELINSVTDFSRADRKIIDIVKEEADYYFAGQKTAAEVAAIIQDRVSLYLSEMS